MAFITHDWNPGGGATGKNHDEVCGVFCDTPSEQWGILNQDTNALMPFNTSFDVLVLPGPRALLPLVLRH